MTDTEDDLSMYHPQGQALSPPDPASPTGTPRQNIAYATVDPPLPRWLEQPEAPTVADREVWAYRGVTLLSDDDCAISLGELAEFVSWVSKHMPDATIRVHKHGLRAWEMKGSNEGPHLDWRDWE